MKIRTLLLGAAATVAMTPAAFAERIRADRDR